MEGNYLSLSLHIYRFTCLTRSHAFFIFCFYEGNVDSTLYEKIVTTLTTSHAPGTTKVATIVSDLNEWYKITLGDAYASYPSLQASLNYEANYVNNLYDAGFIDDRYDDPMARVYCSKIATDQGTEMKTAVNMNHAAGCGKFSTVMLFFILFLYICDMIH